MKEKIPNMNWPKKTALLSALALCVLLFFVIQCGRYARQNRDLMTETEELTAALTEREQTIADKERILANKEQLLDDQTQQTEDLQERLEETSSIEEYETTTGFLKKGGVYLIDNASQLWNVQWFIRQGLEIEPGVPAATASYRLRNDLKIESYDGVSLGTEENPFCGSFDGDGHHLEGTFSYMDGADVPEAAFYTDSTAKIENLQITNILSHHYFLHDQAAREDMETHLPDCSCCRASVIVCEWDMDMRETARVLREYWERNSQKDGAYVSMTFWPDSDEAPDEVERYIQNLHTALTTLAGAEYAEIIEDALPQGTDYLWFVRLEQIGGLTCCTFEISEPAYGPNSHGRTDDSYYIIVEGNWDGEEVPRQCFHIPYTKSEGSSIGRNGYHLEKVDLNFDDRPDLLIHEGSSGGSGGSWGNYRALVWKEDAGQFAIFSSFPEQVSSLE